VKIDIRARQTVVAGVAPIAFPAFDTEATAP
jgi:hypothetical protein